MHTRGQKRLEGVLTGNYLVKTGFFWHVLKGRVVYVSEIKAIL